MAWQDRDALAPLWSADKREVAVHDSEVDAGSPEPPPIRGPIDDVMLRDFWSWRIRGRLRSNRWPRVTWNKPEATPAGVPRQCCRWRAIEGRDGGGPGPRLPRDRSAADAGAGADGASGHPRRNIALGSISDADGRGDAAAQRGDLRDGRESVQHQLAAATGQGAVRGAEAACAGQDRQDEDFSTAADVLETWRRSTRSRQKFWSTGSSRS